MSHSQKYCTHLWPPGVLSPTDTVLEWMDHIHWFLVSSGLLNPNKKEWTCPSDHKWRLPPPTQTSWLLQTGNRESPWPSGSIFPNSVPSIFLTRNIHPRIRLRLLGQFISKFKGKFVYEGKYRSKCIIYEAKCSMCDAIYIGNTQQTFKKIMDGHSSDILRLLKNEQKSDSFAAHFEQHFNTTTSCTYLHNYMTFKAVN